MCGICGVVFPEGRGERPTRQQVVRMRDVLLHRGPDDCGILVEGTTGLGHRRLSIVDIAAGHQPMESRDGRTVIVYNGEIYNHAQERESLSARGRRFDTRSDTETILYLYQEYGDRCVHHLRGMFAFAIWNRRSGELFLARDRLGIKPLYYYLRDDGALCFGSEIKAVLASGLLRPSLNVDALPDFLANRTVTGEGTLYMGVKRLLPGHTLTWKAGTVAIAQYWSPCATGVDSLPATSARSSVERWRDEFEESVRLHLMSDVPLGMFLSGGIDSSAIAAVMSRLVREPVKTFSVAFNEAGASELPFARLVADAFATDHHETIVTPQDFDAALPHLVWHEDEPLAHSASVPLYFVSALARKHVKVVLTGEGSDELLAGYHRYWKTLWNVRAGAAYHRAIPERGRALVRNACRRLAPGFSERKLQRTFLWRTPTIDSIYFDNFAVFSIAQQRQLLAPELLDRIGERDPYAGLRREFDECPEGTLLQRMLRCDLKTYLHELLMKQDQMSMAASIESRVPFLDHKLVEHSLALPDAMKLRGRSTKYVLRRAMQGVLPSAILERPKMGFPVPLGAWFRGPLRHLLTDCVLDERTLSRGLFRPEAVRRLVLEHLAGHTDHSDRLWMLVNFELWHRHLLDGEPLSGALPDVEEHGRGRG